MLFTSTAIVTVVSHNGSHVNPAKADKHGKMPVRLNALAGIVPYEGTVLSGTVAERAQLEVGNSYMVQFTEGTPNSYGRNTNVTRLAILKPMEIIQCVKEMGAPVTVKLNTPTPAEAFETSDVEEAANKF